LLASDGSKSNECLRPGLLDTRAQVTGVRGRIYFTIENKNFYIICDPFLKNGDVQAGWLGVILGDLHQQLALLQFTSESFQDDLLQAIRRAL
jgi:hypothetical protein